MCSQAAALLWAADCLEGLNEVERERLAGVKEATETNNVPLVPVQSKKKLAEWVQVGNSVTSLFVAFPLDVLLPST